MKKAIITGITGQDGSYLTELLLGKGYEVHGIIRRSSTPNTRRIDHLIESDDYGRTLFLHYGDLSDSGSLLRVISEVEPDEIYNLAAQSHVKISFDIPDFTSMVNGIGAQRILEIIRNISPGTRFYQASSSELFGKVAETPQKESTPFHPRSPYAASKLYAYWITINYREAYGLHASNGILFNHESPRRGENFVTRKITRGVAGIVNKTQDRITLGNLDSRRDWGYAGDYVEAMWLMLQQDTPDDYVVATGETHTVREFCEKAFGFAGIDLTWTGDGLDEKGVDAVTGRILVEVDKRFYRPCEVDLLLGDPGKAKARLGWRQKVSFDDLVRMMVESDLKDHDKKFGRVIDI